MSNKSVLAACVVLATCCSANALAGGFYLGVGAGNASIELGHPDQDNFDIDPSEIDLSSDETAFKLFGGYRFSILAAEAAVVDFGSVETGLGTGEVKGYSAFAMLLMGLGPVDLFAKTGGFLWESEVDFEEFSIGDELSTARVEEEDGFDLAYGLGAMVSLFGLSARVEYEYFNVGDKNDVSMISVGASYTF